MKRWILILAIIITARLPLQAQDAIFGTKQGTISFFSKAPLEDIDAKNDKVTALLDTSKNEIAVRVPIQEFQFRNKLMQDILMKIILRVKDTLMPLLKVRLMKLSISGSLEIMMFLQPGSSIFTGLTRSAPLQGNCRSPKIICF